MMKKNIYKVRILIDEKGGNRYELSRPYEFSAYDRYGLRKEVSSFLQENKHAMDLPGLYFFELVSIELVAIEV